MILFPQGSSFSLAALYMEARLSHRPPLGAPRAPVSCSRTIVHGCFLIHMLKSIKCIKINCGIVKCSWYFMNQASRKPAVSAALSVFVSALLSNSKNCLAEMCILLQAVA